MIRLYTTGCPKCMVLEKKLEQNEIGYEKIDEFDVDLLLNKGFDAAPVLEVNDKYMDFSNAITWINNN